MNDSPSILINCDMGESFGQFKIGHDEALMPFIDACNIACGFHAGDPWQMEKTIDLALEHKVQIGAHPGYPDLQGFGRRPMHIPAHELSAMLKYQIAALKGMLESKGGILRYVKPHGALYNTMANDMEMAQTVIEAIRSIDSKLPLMGLAGSPLQQYAERNEVPFIAEAFADRYYETNGTLRSRTLANAVIVDPEKATQQVLQIAYQQHVQTYKGPLIPLAAQSFCIHGDNPSAVNILEVLKNALNDNSLLTKYISNED